MFQAYVDGYQEHLFDMECLAVHNGYWAGYYQSRKPKAVSAVLDKMIREHTKAKKLGKSKNVPKPEVNMELFMQREQRRMAYLARKKGK